MVKRIQVFYSGMVQGVGFRFTAEELADRLGITGWVRNLRDKRVELVAEADEKVLGDFLSGLKQHFASYIKDVDIQWQEATGEFSNFGIRF